MGNINYACTDYTFFDAMYDTHKLYYLKNNRRKIYCNFKKNEKLN